MPESLFLIKLQTWGMQLYLEKRLWHRCFPVNFAKFLRTLIYRTALVATSEQLRPELLLHTVCFFFEWQQQPTSRLILLMVFYDHVFMIMGFFLYGPYHKGNPNGNKDSFESFFRRGQTSHFYEEIFFTLFNFKPNILLWRHLGTDSICILTIFRWRNKLAWLNAYLCFAFIIIPDKNWASRVYCWALS